MNDEIRWLEEQLGKRFDKYPLLVERLGVRPQCARLLLLLYESDRPLTTWYLGDQLPHFWDTERDDRNTIKVTVCYARRKLGHDVITTIPWVGYRLAPRGRALVDKALAE